MTRSYGFINAALCDVNGNKIATINANKHPNEHHKQKHVNALTLCLPTQFCKNGQWWSKSTMHLLHVEQCDVPNGFTSSHFMQYAQFLNESRGTTVVGCLALFSTSVCISISL